MAIDRDLGRRRDAPMPSPGRRGQAMRSPGTIDDRARDIAPDGVPFNFYDSGRMDPPRRRFPDNIPMPTPNPFPDPRMPMPMPLPRPMPNPRFPMPSPGPRGPMPMPMPAPKYDFFNPPPGMGPFRQQPFPDQMPRRRKGLEQLMPDLPNLMERPILPRDFVPEFEPPILPRDFEVGPMQPAAATIDPSDYRTIIKMIEQGLDPEDYMNRGGIASLLE